MNIHQAQLVTRKDLKKRKEKKRQTTSNDTIMRSQSLLPFYTNTRLPLTLPLLAHALRPYLLLDWLRMDMMNGKKYKNKNKNGWNGCEQKRYFKYIWSHTRYRNVVNCNIYKHYHINRNPPSSDIRGSVHATPLRFTQFTLYGGIQVPHSR